MDSELTDGIQLNASIVSSIEQGREAHDKLSSTTIALDRNALNTTMGSTELFSYQPQIMSPALLAGAAIASNEAAAHARSAVTPSGMMTNLSDVTAGMESRLSQATRAEIGAASVMTFSDFKAGGPAGTLTNAALFGGNDPHSVAAMAASGYGGPHMTIVVENAPGVTLSAAAQNALNYAAQYLGSLIADPVAVTIQANIANLNSVSKTGILAYGEANAYYVPYFVAEGEVAKHDPGLVLPKTDVAAGGVAAVVTKSELQAWGLPTQGYYQTAGSIVINTAYQSYFDYSTNNVIQAANTNGLDFVGLALHELSHALGRIRYDQVTAANGRYSGDPLASPMDLTAFTAPGTLQHSATAGVGPIPYFSTDGGKTPLVYSASQTRSDWNNFLQNKAFLHDAWSGFLYPGLATMSSTDLTFLNAIGFDIRCFAPGTRILTTRGDIAVEQLALGDNAVLHDGKIAPITWIGHRTVDLAHHPRPETVQPILIKAGALGENLPHRDLTLSPDHALFLDGHLIPAKALLNGTTIRQRSEPSITYYHVELPAHAVLLAEGAPVESYLETGNRTAFENSGVAVQLHPQFSPAQEQAQREANGCAPFAETGAVVEAVRARLLALAAIPTTDEPILKITYARGAAMITSRTAIPGYISANPADRRRLGVKIAALHVNGRAIPIDHPALVTGWHAMEPDGRWTNGAAIVPASLLDGGVLTVEIAATLPYVALARAA